MSSRRGALTHAEAQQILRLSREARAARVLSSGWTEDAAERQRRFAADNAASEALAAYVYGLVSFEEMDAAKRARDLESAEAAP